METFVKITNHIKRHLHGVKGRIIILIYQIRKGSQCKIHETFPIYDHQLNLLEAPSSLLFEVIA